MTARRDSGRIWILPALIAVFALNAGLCAAAESSPDSSAAEEKDQIWQQVPPRVNVGSLVYVPKLWYSSETSWWIGGQLIHPFRLPGTSLSIHGSDIRVKGRATFEGQGKVEIKTRLNWGDGRHALVLKGGYNSLPARFYGLGPETEAEHKEIYRSQRLLAYAEYLHRVRPHLRAGLRYEIEDFKLLEAEPGGFIDRCEVPCAEDRRIHGAGFLMEWDTRDRKYSPTCGSYHQFFALFFDEELGGTANFNNYNIDMRWYRSLAADQVLAAQLFYYAAMGDTPYWRYAVLGGRDHTRAYRSNRFMDRVLVAAQLEYRTPFRHRFGGSLFIGLARVAHEFEEIDHHHLQPTLGAGLRFQPKKADGIKVRFDLAFGKESVRVDLSLDESF